MRLAATITFLVTSPAHAQDYIIPADYLAIKTAIGSRLSICLAGSKAVESDVECGNLSYGYCLALAPHGDSLIGAAICGGTVSRVLDRAIVDAWLDLIDTIDEERFADFRFSQRAWFANRTIEASMERQRHQDVQLAAANGWARYNDVSIERLAHLRHLTRGFR